MTKLSAEARSILSQGLAADGPSAVRRGQVKVRLFAALGGGTLTLGSALSSTAAAAPAVTSGSAVLAKGLGVGTLVLWFGAGAALGVGASGTAALVAHHAPREKHAALHAPAPVRPPSRSLGVGPTPRRQLAAPSAAQPAELGAARQLPSSVASGAARAPAVRGPERTEPEERPSVSAPEVSTSSLSEEAQLVERAQRALTATNPEHALALLAEHEQRFARGALSEERRAAQVLALCELGRVGEARSLARAFVRVSPRSVLVPRLEHSCAAPF